MINGIQFSALWPGHDVNQWIRESEKPPEGRERFANLAVRAVHWGAPSCAEAPSGSLSRASPCSRLATPARPARCIGKQGETVTVSTARVAVATTPERSALWAQVAVTGASAGFVWILPVRPGARIDLGSDAWLDALDAATSPVVLPPSTATPNTCDVGLSPQHLPPAASAQSSLPGAIGLFTDPAALESFVTAAGFAIPPDLASALGSVFAGGAVIASTYAAADRPVRTLRIVDSGPPLLPFALTGVPGSTTQATAFVMASAGATAGSSPLTLDPSRVLWASDGLSSFVQARDFSPRRVAGRALADGERSSGSARFDGAGDRTGGDPSRGRRTVFLARLARTGCARAIQPEVRYGGHCAGQG